MPRAAKRPRLLQGPPRAANRTPVRAPSRSRSATSDEPFERSGHPVPGVVEHDVDAADRDRFRDGVLDLRRIGDVQRELRNISELAQLRTFCASLARIVAITRHPLAENSLTEVRPRPEEVPVMKIVF